jgi:putative redox protein
MKTSKIVYTGSLRTEAVHLRSGTKILTDAPVDNHGKGEFFSPTDLVATALASCMISIMGIVAMRHTFSVEGAVAEVEKIMVSDPRRIAEIKVDIYMPEGNFTDKDKKMLEQTALSCPVAKSISPEIKQTIAFYWKS